MVLAVFTGTTKSERIKVWDVRARTPVYELCTGNNQVSSLAWDPKRNCLYAATQCSHVDRNGYHHGYRRAKFPKRSSRFGPNEAVGKEATDEEMDGWDSDDDERRWPTGAWHGEDAFGYTFDAGEHRICMFRSESCSASLIKNLRTQIDMLLKKIRIPPWCLSTVTLREVDMVAGS
jgi:hypothetical protein